MSNEDGLRERKKRATRQAISDIATRLFIERGFDNVTVADVAKAANVAKMTVFNYFPRKEDLFFDREDESHELVRTALAKRPSGVSPIEVLYRLVHELIEQKHPFTKFTDGVSSFWSAVEQSETLRSRAREQRDVFVNGLAKMIADSVGVSHPSPEAHLIAATVTTVWCVAYIEAQRRQRQGEAHDAVHSVFVALIDRGFMGIRASMKGTPFE